MVKQSAIVVYLYFSKTFDKADQDILMSKMLHKYIRCVILSWFKSYLRNGKQYISVNNCSFSMSNGTLYVPQGSVFGTVLFLFYINDKYRSSYQMSFVHFSNDTIVCASDSDINNVPATVNRELVGVDNLLRPTDLISMVAILNI